MKYLFLVANISINNLFSCLLYKSNWFQYFLSYVSHKVVKRRLYYYTHDQPYPFLWFVYGLRKYKIGIKLATNHYQFNKKIINSISICIYSSLFSVTLNLLLARIQTAIKTNITFPHVNAQPISENKLSAKQLIAGRKIWIM